MAVAARQALEAEEEPKPVLEMEGADLGPGPFRFVLKLELTQHSGSFKACGAFDPEPAVRP
ncbi:MAG TPA: hypothetical protein VGE72_23960 [Azospirillum sp.]